MPSGDYTVSIVDELGCSTSEKVRVASNSAVGLDTEVSNNNCTGSGDIWITPRGGSGQYTLAWSGPSSGSASVGSDGYSIAGVPSGAYTVSIVDALGCSTSEKVRVAASSAVGLDTEVSNDFCRQTGDIWITPTGGSGQYTVQWSGPSSGSASVGSGGYSIAGVPSGDYTVSLVDALGCSTSEKVRVTADKPSLTYNLTASDATNGKGGIISVQFGNGAEPHTVSWTGPVSNFVRTNGSSYDIINLLPGNYSITVTDANGCFRTEQITVGNIAFSLNFGLSSTDAVNGKGGVISVSISNGRGPYTISWSGPVSGHVRTNNSQFDITDLPPGTYTITITDADGNFSTQTITVGNIVEQIVQFGISVKTSPSKCDQHGSINLEIIGGRPNYNVSWTGTQSGSLVTSNLNTDISLPVGSYTVTVTDADGKVQSGLANIRATTSDLYCSTHANNAICDANGSIFVIISGGKTPYQLKWDGPSAGGVTISGDFTITNLPAGTYRTMVIDAEGCSVSESATVGISASNLQASLIGEHGAITVGFQSGTPNYSISYSGPKSGSAVFAGTNRITGLPVGLYRVNIEDGNGCTLSKSVRVPTSDIMSIEDQRVTSATTTSLANKPLTKSTGTVENTNDINLAISIDKELGDKLSVGQNFPNPFLHTTQIPFSVPASMEVVLLVHDSYGSLVKEVRQDFAAGTHQFDIDGTALGARGVYYYTIHAGEETVTKRMVIIQ